MRKLSSVLVVLVIVLLGHHSYAQINRKSVKKNNKRIGSYRGVKSHFGKDKVYTAIGFSVNALNYYGDLSPRPQRVSTDISFTKPGFAASIYHRFGPRYSVQAAFMWGVLKGSDSESADKNDLSNGVFRYKRNLSFRNQIKEFSVVAIIDLFKNEGNYISRVKWTPYVFVGVAGFLHNPKAKAPAGTPDAGKWVALRPLGTEGQYSTLEPTDANYGIKPYSLLQAAIPFGVGARLRLNEVIDLSADIGFRYTFTDYLDDVSKNYVDLGVFTGPNAELARAMSYRTGELSLANPNPQTYTSTRPGGGTYTVEAGYGSESVENKRGGKNERDIYMVTSIRLSYIIGATFHRAKFR